MILQLYFTSTYTNFINFRSTQSHFQCGDVKEQHGQLNNNNFLLRSYNNTNYNKFNPQICLSSDGLYFDIIYDFTFEIHSQYYNV